MPPKRVTPRIPPPRKPRKPPPPKLRKPPPPKPRNPPPPKPPPRKPPPPKPLANASGGSRETISAADARNTATRRMAWPRQKILVSRASFLTSLSGCHTRVKPALAQILLAQSVGQGQGADAVL